MTTTSSGRTGGDELTNLALIGLVALLTLSAVLRFAANVAALFTGHQMPDGDPATGLKALTDPTNPGEAFGADGLSPFVYWLAVAVMLASAVVVAWLAWRLVGGPRTPSAHASSLAGLATTSDLARTASPQALVKRSGTLRPSLEKAAPADVGYLLGHARGRQVWASVEDSMLVLGPPRSGKGLHLVINAVLDAPGAVATTSTRPDTLAVTLAARQQVGPVAVFDPQKLAEGLGEGLRWSPIRGCDVPRRAMVRAAGLAKDTGIGGKGVENGAFWENTTRGALQALLHAAALAGRTAKDLYVWSLSPAAAADAVAILRAHPRAAHGWGEGLEGMLNGEGRSRDSVWVGVRQALSALADPDVLHAVSPGPDEHFDPKAFLRNRGTLYLLATGSGASASSALVAALIEDLTETAGRLAASSPGQRLDPPLLLALDEIGNIAPLPSLRFLMADGGGTGITTIPVFQSLAQARDQWGPESASAIWDSSIVKVILGGTSSASDLRDLSALLGEKDEVTDSLTVGYDGSRSLQRSLRRVPVMPPEKIRTLPFGQGLVLLRSAPPIVATLRPWTGRQDAARLAEGRIALENELRAGSGPRVMDGDDRDG
ncbi:TraM recognition domain-containing protein [Antribacter sp. KLBMP9083]|uniref:TraM recognition domain-containing protein n=1 Tax=Antribacter soli TaxID=2910976 RepID=A0AA41UE32_9MICO|nr:type IV secretory system conjugative DNA transfer family protein [Antribacter soli]MCF4123674.1 TraM recognition domain-containing protein [Antribacter soli]